MRNDEAYKQGWKKGFSDGKTSGLVLANKAIIGALPAFPLPDKSKHEMLFLLAQIFVAAITREARGDSKPILDDELAAIKGELPENINDVSFT